MRVCQQEFISKKRKTKKWGNLPKAFFLINNENHLKNYQLKDW